MGELTTEDVAAIRLNGLIICCDCWTDEEFDSVERCEDYLTYDDIAESDSVFCCDRCQKKI